MISGAYNDRDMEAGGSWSHGASGPQIISVSNKIVLSDLYIHICNIKSYHVEKHSDDPLIRGWPGEKLLVVKPGSKVELIAPSSNCIAVCYEPILGRLQVRWLENIFFCYWCRRLKWLSKSKNNPSLLQSVQVNIVLTDSMMVGTAW